MTFILMVYDCSAYLVTPIFSLAVIQCRHIAIPRGSRRQIRNDASEEAARLVIVKTIPRWCHLFRRGRVHKLLLPFSEEHVV